MSIEQPTYKFIHETKCPQCGSLLNKKNIENGWRNDPNDITTLCPHCTHRFVATILVTARYMSIEATIKSYAMRWLCPIQLEEATMRLFTDDDKRPPAQAFLSIYSQSYDSIAPEWHDVYWNLIERYGTVYMGLLIIYKNNSPMWLKKEEWDVVKLSWTSKINTSIKVSETVTVEIKKTVQVPSELEKTQAELQRTKRNWQRPKMYLKRHDWHLKKKWA